MENRALLDENNRIQEEVIKLEDEKLVYKKELEFLISSMYETIFQFEELLEKMK